MKNILSVGAGLLLAIGLVSCRGSDADEVSVEEITVSAAWAKNSPMMAANGAAYMTITGDENGDRLIAASVDSSIAETTTIHEVVAMDEGGMDGDAMDEGTMDGDAMDAGTMDEGAMMTMRPVEAIEVPANGSVVLEPGGYHVMLENLVEPLEVGDEFEIFLRFEETGRIGVMVTVQDEAP